MKQRLLPRKYRRSLEVKAKLFRGFGDLSRLLILEVLREGPKNVSQIVQATGLSQPNVSMHLDCLWCCGLVDRETLGRFTFYRLKSSKVVQFLQGAELLLGQVCDRIEECRRYEERRIELRRAR